MKIFSTIIPPSFLTILYEPQSTFQKLKENPSWQSVFIVYCGGLMSATLLLFMLLLQIKNPLVEDRFKWHMMSYFYNKWILISLLPVPIVESIKLLTLASFALGLCWILNIFRINFKELFSFICHARIILMMEAIFNLFIMLTLGPQELRLRPNFNRTGFHIFFDPDHVNNFLYMLLNNISIFSIWYVFLIYIALSTIPDITRKKVASISISIWLGELLVGILFGLITGNHI